MQYREPAKEDYLRSLLFIVLFVAALAAGAVLFLPSYWYVWVLVIIVGLYLLVAYDARSTAYRCARCGNVFEISFTTDLVSMKSIGRRGSWKYLKCPSCGARSRAAVLVKLASQGGGSDEGNGEER